MQVWITGCSGFVGGRLALALREKGAEVIGLSRRASLHAASSVSIDLASDKGRVQLAGLLDHHGPPQVVIHAAARQPGRYPLTDYVRSNVAATAVLLEALNDAPPQQFLYLSTLSVYQQPAALPVRELSPTEGDSPYSITKLAGEHLCKAFQNRAPVVIFRLPSLYGAGQSDSFVDGLMRLAMDNQPIELYSSGRIVRDAIHVADAVQAIVTSVLHPPAARFVCANLGCGRAITSQEYAETLIKVLNSKSVVRPVDRPSPARFDLYADITAARQTFDFQPPALHRSLERYADELRSGS